MEGNSIQSENPNDGLTETKPEPATEPKEEPMLDVHAPHEKMHGWKDFFLHLITITIGLLIALSLEGMVEWFHERHLVHEAESSLHGEIASNSQGLAETEADIHQQQESLQHDVKVLKSFLRDHKMPQDSHMEITFHIRTFDSVSWKAAQSTGAMALMPYALAQQYSEIYSVQSEIDAIQNQAARDAIVSMAPFENSVTGDPDLKPEQAEAIKDRIEVLQAQLGLLSSIVTALDAEYRKFLAVHPE
jgi:hypothetical protein